MSRSGAPRLLKDVCDVEELLSRGAAGCTVVLSRRTFAAFRQGSVAEFRRGLREISGHHDDCGGGGSREVFGQEAPSTLEHAGPWVDTGSVFEELVSYLEKETAPDFIFCLDPWAAQLRSGAGEIAPRADWVYVSDLVDRKSGVHREYWGQLEAWFSDASFQVIISRGDW